jgi:MinD-like ATPase involved in chromosome partitioning or flagellar assembly
VRATVLHPRDAVAEDYDVFIGDDCTSFLSRRLVDELHRRGRSVLGVFDPDDPRGKGELLEWGVDDVIARDAPPEAFVTAIGELHGRARRPIDEELAALVHGTAPQERRALDPPAPIPATSGDAPAAGVVVAVGSAGGGIGATEVALALGLRASDHGRAAVLVDADDVAPAVAQRVGAAPYPNLRAAVDVLDAEPGQLDRCLQPVLGGRLLVLPGLSSPRSWSEQRPTDAAEVIRALARGQGEGERSEPGGRGSRQGEGEYRAPRPRDVVVNVGHQLEDLRAGGGPPRFGLTRQLLSIADRVVVVALPTPVGLTRLLEWLADVRTIRPDVLPHVVFNRTPAGTFARAELVDELSRTVVPAGVWFLPHDPRVVAAAWAGRRCAPGPFTRAVDGLAGALLPAPAGRARRRRMRR